MISGGIPPSITKCEARLRTDHDEVGRIKSTAVMSGTHWTLCRYHQSLILVCSFMFMYLILVQGFVFSKHQ